MKNLTAIVLGATGLVGRSVVDQLIAHPDFAKVISITRRPIPYSSQKVQNVVVDFDDLKASAHAFKGDCLFSCLGTTKKSAGSIAAQRKVDVDYQLEVAQIAAENGVPHYLLVSSASADEASSFAYNSMKGFLEEKVKRLPFKRVSIFQPSLLVGERSETRTAEKLASWVLPVVCALPGLGKYRPISGDEVALKMIQVSLKSGTGIEVFTLDQVFPS